MSTAASMSSPMGIHSAELEPIRTAPFRKETT